ncbi:carbohydrate binding domain-containing protein, partial [Duffyella gerundensis]|uniref:carbohydrate binding domain-containing protein n=1 Tax=Duffyella gerundensis TaxID=1619313 RepID=UPI003F6DCC9D
EANALVMIEFGRPGEPYSTGYTAIANARGEWSFTPPDTLGLGEWVFRAKAGNGSAYSNSWSLTVTEGELNTALYDFEKIAPQTITGAWKYDELTIIPVTTSNVTYRIIDDSRFGKVMSIDTTGTATNKLVQFRIDFEQEVNFVQLDAIDWEGAQSYVSFHDSAGTEIGRVYAKDIRSDVTQMLRFYTDRNEIAYMQFNMQSNTPQFIIDDIILKQNHNISTDPDSGSTKFNNADGSQFNADVLGTYEFNDGLKMVIHHIDHRNIYSIADDGNHITLRSGAIQEFNFGQTNKVQFDIAHLDNYNLDAHKLEVFLTTGEKLLTERVTRNGRYYFEAPEGKLISHILFTNGYDSVPGYVNGAYTIGYLSWGKNVTAKPVYEWGFEDNSLQGWTLVGEYAKTSSNTSVVKINDRGYVLKTNTDGGHTYNDTIMYHDVRVEAGKTYDFSLYAQRSAPYNGDYVGKVGMTVDGQSVIAGTDITGNHTLTGSWTATTTGTVRINITNATTSGHGNDFFLDNIRIDERLPERSVNEQSANSVDEASAFTYINSVDELQVINGGDGVDTLVITGAQQTLVLSDVADKLNSVEVIDITGSGDNRLELNAGDVLSHGGRDLFIDDGKLQFMVQGNAGDTVQLDDLLPDDTGDWIAQNGTVTVAGIEYQVFSHSGEEAEVLIQQGIKTELI